MADSRTLVLLRHGQTDWNLQGRAQGHTDIELNRTGQEEARAVAPRIAALSPAALWSSDLARAAQTAQILAGACSLSVVKDARLREYDVGEAAGLRMSEASSWSMRESSDAVGSRLVDALRDALASIEPGETVVAVTHGAALRTGLVRLLGLPAEADAALRGMDNCHWASVAVDSMGTARLVDYNRS